MDLHISKKSKIILGLSAIAILIPIASSLFIITDTTETTTTTDIREAVAYIEDIYFPTVSDAIIYANGNNTEDTIYVIPGDVDEEYTQSYIDRDCTLESEDTLIIPYEEEEYEDEDRTGVNDYFADYNQETETYDYYLTSEVIIREGITLINEGTIYIGGILGKSSDARQEQRPTGHVAEKYAQISMEYGSNIENYGTICSYGFIKERLSDSSNNTTLPEIINYNGAYFYTPITIYDYFGGTYTVGASDNDAMPFYIFDFNNIQTIITFEAGSKMYCYYYLYFSSVTINLDGLFYIIGEKDEDCLFGLESGSVSFYYRGKTHEITSADENKIYTYSCSYLDFNTISGNSADDATNLARTYVKINEDANLYIQHFKFKIADLLVTEEIDTANFFVPFSYKFIIEVMSGGTINIENNTQFLGGSHLIIDEGGTANFNAATLFYGTSTQYLYNSSLKDYYPNFLGSAECLINGMAYLNSDFGGIVTTTAPNSYIIPGQDFISSASTTQVISAERNLIFVQAETTEVSYYAQAYISYSEEESYGTLRNIVNSYVYKSIASSDDSDNYYFYGTSVPNSLTVEDDNGNTELNLENNEANNYSISLNAYLNWEDTEYSLNNDDITWTTSNTGYAQVDDDGVLYVNYTSSSPTTITITAYYTYKYTDNIMKTLYGTYPINIEGSCFEKGTLILTKRGNIPVEKVSLKDEVLSFNHFTGNFEYKPISIIVNHGFNLYMVINLYFDDGSQFHVIGNHGLFDKTLNKYVDFSINTYKQFIGHEFVIYEDNEIKIVTLVNATSENKFTECYSCFSFENLNVVANNFLSIGSDLYGFYNIFSYLNNMQYDPTEIEKDIETYGLYEYEDFKHLISKEIFDAFGVKYFKISIGKGLMTYQQLLNYIEKELNDLVNNGEAFTDFKTY